MIDYTHVILSIALSLLVAVGLSLYSYKRLSVNKFFSLSATTLRIFIISRAAYYFVFTLMICAFFLAIIVFGVSGEQARLLIATAPKELNASTLILAEWGNWMLPVLFVTMFVSIFSLGQLGRLVLRSIPEDGAPGKEYGLFRFHVLSACIVAHRPTACIRVTSTLMRTLPKEKTAVVVLQFGGPDSLDAVEPFLYNLFSDNDIVQIPFSFLLQKPVAKLISSQRSKSVGEKYGEIGGKSPIVEKTHQQVAALQKRLDSEYGKGVIPVILAMRYWKPFTQEAMDKVRSHGIKNIVFLPLYAQYSKTNAASSYNEWDRVKKRNGVTFNEKRIYYYHKNEKYIRAINERIDEALTRFAKSDDVHILFSAHGIPIDLVFEGDAYPVHINETMEAIMQARTFKHQYSLSYQSKVGPKQWLTPSTEETLKIFGKSGMKKLLVAPIAFVSDHIETLHELDIELREIAEHVGIEEYQVMEGLNDSPIFIDTLFDLVEKELKEFV